MMNPYARVRKPLQQQEEQPCLDPLDDTWVERFMEKYNISNNNNNDSTDHAVSAMNNADDGIYKSDNFQLNNHKSETSSLLSTKLQTSETKPSSNTTTSATGFSFELPHWQRAQSRQLSFGSAEILTMSECHTCLNEYIGQSIRTTGRVDQKLVHNDQNNSTVVLLVLGDPLQKSPIKVNKTEYKSSNNNKIQTISSPKLKVTPATADSVNKTNSNSTINNNKNNNKSVRKSYPFTPSARKSLLLSSSTGTRTAGLKVVTTSKHKRPCMAGSNLFGKGTTTTTTMDQINNTDDENKVNNSSNGNDNKSFNSAVAPAAPLTTTINQNRALTPRRLTFATPITSVTTLDDLLEQSLQTTTRSANYSTLVVQVNPDLVNVSDCNVGDLVMLIGKACCRSLRKTNQHLSTTVQPGGSDIESNNDNSNPTCCYVDARILRNVRGTNVSLHNHALQARRKYLRKSFENSSIEQKINNTRALNTVIQGLGPNHHDNAKSDESSND